LSQYATSQKAVRSIPDVIGFFNLPNPLSCTVDSVDSTSKINKYQESLLGVKGSQLVRLANSPPYVSQFSRRFGSLVFSQPCGLLQRITGIAILYPE
jgi:hypothetical protein